MKNIVKIRDLCIGDGNAVIIAGPCSVESFDQLHALAACVKSSGAHILRGGAFKPRTSPYSFQGLGLEALKMLKTVCEEFDLPCVTEVLAADQIELVIEHADIIQIGTRNMFNYPLLKEIGRTNHPVLLKRGFMASVEEWLLAAEYLIAEGNKKIILCERGIRTFETSTRNTLDLSAIPVVQKKSKFPVIVDPSHATGREDLISAMSLAALAAGADGVMVEVHNNPKKALCDGLQSLTIESFEKLAENLRKLDQFLIAQNLKNL